MSSWESHVQEKTRKHVGTYTHTHTQRHPQESKTHKYLTWLGAALVTKEPQHVNTYAHTYTHTQTNNKTHTDTHAHTQTTKYTQKNHTSNVAGEHLSAFLSLT
jgi:hypothetical protein